MHNQKFQTQLDEWKVDLAKLKTQASVATAVVQSKLNNQVEKLGHKIQEAFWCSVKSTVREAVSKFKD